MDLFTLKRPRPMWWPWSSDKPANLVESVYTGNGIRCAWCEARGIPGISPAYKMHMPGFDFRPAHVCPRCRDQVNRIWKPGHQSFDLVNCRPSKETVNVGAGYVPTVYAPWYLAAILQTMFEPVEKPDLIERFMLIMTIRRGVVLPQEPRKRRQSAGRKGGGAR